MDKSSNNSILSKFISKEIEHIYNKYNNIPEEEVNNIRNFIEKVVASSLRSQRPPGVPRKVSKREKLNFR